MAHSAYIQKFIMCNIVKHVTQIRGMGSVPLNSKFFFADCLCFSDAWRIDSAAHLADVC